MFFTHVLLNFIILLDTSTADQKAHSQPLCNLKAINSESAELTLEKSKELIITNGIGARIVKCERIKEYSNLVSIEIDLGQAGTKAQVTERVLRVYSLEKSKAALLKELNLGEISKEKRNGKIVITTNLMPYTFEKNQNSLDILWTQSGAREKIK